MKTKAWTIAVAAALVVFTMQPADAAVAVGYNRIIVPAGTDVRLTIPFNSVPVEQHAVTSVDTVNGKISVANAVTGLYTDTHYVRFVNGNGEGLWTTIAGISGAEITLDVGQVASKVNVGDVFRIYKHHTLDSIFQAGMKDRMFKVGTQVLIYENNIDSMKMNKSAAKVAVYSPAGVWAGAGVTGSTILKPETQFILRNQSGDALEMITLGQVPDYSVSMLVAPSGDLVVGSGYPLPVVLKDSGLGASLRQVLFYDNGATGYNKSSSKVATYSPAGSWVGAGVTGNEIIAPSEMITLRLPSSEAGDMVTVTKPY